MYKKVCEKFIKASKEVIVADPLDPKVADEPMVMGPVISAKSRQFILDMIQAERAIGAFYFMMIEEERAGFYDRLDRFYRERGAQPVQ